MAKTLEELQAERDQLAANIRSGVTTIRNRERSTGYDIAEMRKGLAELDSQIDALGGKRRVRQIRITTVKDL